MEDNAGKDSVRNVTTGDHSIVIGNNSHANAHIKIDWTVTSDERDKTEFEEVPHGLDFVNQLKPVSFVFKKSREDELLMVLKSMDLRHKIFLL